jgi:septum site-determining protein MinC
MMDGEQPTFQHRIADLLDDVTETAEINTRPSTAEPAPPPAPSQPDPAQPAATQPAATQPAATQPAATQPAATQPAVSDLAALPPFLATSNNQPAEDPRAMPGTALFAHPAARAAAKTDLQPVQPVAPTGSSLPPIAPPIPPLVLTSATLNGAALDTQADGAPVDGATATLETLTPPAAIDQAVAPAGPPISIKGRADGLVVEIGKGSWSEILASLDDRLQQSASFFRNARVAVDLGARMTTEAELAPLLDLLKTHGLMLGAVRTSNERTFQAALALGLTSTLESTEGAPVADAAPATTNTTVGAYFVYRGYLRSGHRLQRKESILVIGDVNPGAEVSSEGDVLVWGRLRGVVHAGSQGNQRAIVAALDLEPTQLRIANVMTIGPDPRPGQPGKWFWRRSANKRAEIARVVNEMITLEEWDATRPGGLVSLRRGG